MALIAAMRPSVLPVGTFSATDSPRFGFRGTGFVVGRRHARSSPTSTCCPPPPRPTAASASPVLARQRGTAAGDAETGELRLASVVATDRARDLALLRIEGVALPALALAEAGRGARRPWRSR
ncbi:MAG: hypothetical protein MZW92_27010 [Comamonadaceae bacterium]|nr:hypothetical protein [Comamonadaceae bacterium]